MYLFIYTSIDLFICPFVVNQENHQFKYYYCWRGFGVGGYLLRLIKDPAIVGQYDVVLTFANHKAEKFISRHGFTDDPIITARYKYIGIWSVTPAICPSLPQNTMLVTSQ